MIRKSYIAPTKLIKEFGNKGDFHLTLSHLLPPPGSSETNEYELAITESGLPIILDNGLFENGVPEDTHSLIVKAKRIEAEIVFAPDILFDRAATEASFDVFVKEAREEGYEGKFAAVVQANNPEDYIESYKHFVKHPDVSLIGLSILSIPESFKEVVGTDDIVETRRHCLKELQKLEDHKDSHLLGAGNSYRDVFLAHTICPWIVSHDSSSAVWNAVQGRCLDMKTLEIEGGKTPIHVDFDWNEEITEDLRSRINFNIDVIERLCK